MASSACKKFGAVALADAGDQGFLAIEVDVERARADGGRLADVLHGGGVKAAARKAAMGGVQDVVAPGALGIGFEFGHRAVVGPAGWIKVTGVAKPAVPRPLITRDHKNERSFCLDHNCGNVKENGCSVWV